jgi:hypothetical protein
MKTQLTCLSQATSMALLNRWWLRIILILLFLSHLSSGALGQAKQWDKTFGGEGGTSGDELRSVQQTSDGGYILGGYSSSDISGDKSEASRGDTDYWVVKLDADGNKEWDRTFGGNEAEQLTSLQQTSDGGYILGGFSFSGISGDKTEASRGGWDYWVVKLDGTGNKEWDRTFGGSRWDYLFSLQQTSDGGYILGGRSLSDISGDKTEINKGFCGEIICSYDYWVVKLDGAGNKEWDRTFGGSESDELHSLQQTSDGGYILGGYSYSPISGDKTEANRGEYDFWVVKLDAGGNKEWDKTFGGNSFDNLASLQQTSDGGYILGGWSDSGLSGDKTQASRGFYDYWVVKLNEGGDKEWDKRFGGKGRDELTSLQQTSDGGYILGGWSDSGFSGDKTQDNKGGCSGGSCPSDYWVVKLNEAGNKEWDRTFGGNNADFLYSLQQTSDGGYILGGSSVSEISGDKTEASRGYYDYWVVKLYNVDICPQEVQSFTLVNADTNQDLMPLEDGDVIDLTIMPTQNLKIRANTTPATVGSVVFNLDGTEVVENLSPYRIGVPLTAGQYTLTATPFCAARGSGGTGTALTIPFTVINPVPGVVDLELTQITSQNPLLVGEPLEFDVILSNKGNAPATGVVVEIKDPSTCVGITPTFTVVPPTNGFYNAATQQWSIPSLSSGQSATLTIKVSVNLSNRSFLTVYSIAEVIASDQEDTDSEPNNNKEEEDDQSKLGVDILRNLSLFGADLSLTALSGSGEATITLLNNGPRTASNIEVEITTNDFVHITSNDPNFSPFAAFPSRGGIWSIAELGSGCSISLTIMAEGAAAFTAVVTHPNDPNSNNNQTHGNITENTTPENTGSEQVQNIHSYSEESESLRLHPSFPNPFNTSITISFELERESTVQLTILNEHGGLVNHLLDEYMPAGTHEITWQPTHLSSGVYIVQLRADNVMKTQRIIYMR